VGEVKTLEHGQRAIRPATLADSRFIYALAMDPSVREMSTRSEEFTFEEHERWYAGKLSDDGNRIWIMEVDEVPVAQVRYGFAVGCAEIAISVSPAHQGKGYAGDLLDTTMPWAAQWLNVSRFVALVLTTNLRSKYLFEHAGFTYVGDEERMGKQHWRYERAV